MIKRTAALMLAAAAIAGVAACGDDSDDGASGASADETTTSAETGSAEPSVEFVTPKDGAMEGDKVTAEVKLDNFEIAPDEVGMEASEGQGHLHFSLDEGKYDYPKYSGENGKLAEQLGVDGQYSPSTEPTITYTGIPEGEHTLEVYLAENDHSDTGVSAETSFTVE